MKDPYYKIFTDIVKAINKTNERIAWIAKRTLSAKDFMEFIDEFSEKTEKHEEMIEWMKQERQVKRE